MSLTLELISLLPLEAARATPVVRFGAAVNEKERVKLVKERAAGTQCIRRREGKDMEEE
jgi:hypothetical protein